MSKEKKERILVYKILYTVMILVIYLLGRSIALYGIDLKALHDVRIDAQSIFVQNMTGDLKNCSLFILGVWPYMWGSMLMIVYVAIKSIDKTNRISQKRMNIVTYEITMVIALIQAYQKSREYTYTVPENMIPLARLVVIVQMLAGMLLILWLCDRNQKYGVGGRMGIFIVNITDGIFSMLAGHDFSELVLPVCLGLIGIPVMMLLETSEKRIPVQRVSIHNIHADKNYISYKLNPVGVMPIMFTSVFFMLPQLIVKLLAEFYPDRRSLIYLSDNMILTRPVGVVTYLIVQSLLVIGFSFLMLNPSKMAEGLLKSGDSILDIYAGKPTKKYLIRTVFRLSLFSSLVLAVCMGVPLSLQFTANLDSSLAMLPCSIMMLTGLWITLYREAVVYRHMEQYRPLI